MIVGTAGFEPAKCLPNHLPRHLARRFKPLTHVPKIGCFHPRISECTIFHGDKQFIMPYPFGRRILTKQPKRNIFGAKVPECVTRCS